MYVGLCVRPLRLREGTVTVVLPVVERETTAEVDRDCDKNELAD